MNSVQVFEVFIKTKLLWMIDRDKESFLKILDGLRCMLKTSVC